MDTHNLRSHHLPMAKKRGKTRYLPPKGAAYETQRRLYPPTPLKQWFKKFKIKQYKVAAGIGVDESSLSQVVSGKRPYLRHHLEDISLFLTKETGRRITPSMLLSPPADDDLVLKVQQLSPEDQKRALRVLEATFGE